MSAMVLTIFYRRVRYLASGSKELCGHRVGVQHAARSQAERAGAMLEQALTDEALDRPRVLYSRVGAIERGEGRARDALVEPAQPEPDGLAPQPASVER